jgi:hypothetical protein
MLFMGEWLLLSAVWALGALIAEVDSRILQNIGSALAHSAVVGFTLSLILGPGLRELEPPWLGTLAFEAAAAVLSYLAGQLIARLAYVADGSQANKMALNAALGYVLINLFWRWAIST